MKRIPTRHGGSVQPSTSSKVPAHILCGNLGVKPTHVGGRSGIDMGQKRSKTPL